MAKRIPHRVGDIWRHPKAGQTRVEEVRSIGGDLILVFSDGHGFGRPAFARFSGYRRVAFATVLPTSEPSR